MHAVEVFVILDSNFVFRGRVENRDRARDQAGEAVVSHPRTGAEMGFR